VFVGPSVCLYKIKILKIGTQLKLKRKRKTKKREKEKAKIDKKKKKEKSGAHRKINDQSGTASFIVCL
jgi:hypothetical protein